MDWLPVAAAGICILISIPLSKLIKIKFAYLALAAIIAFAATFIFPSFFDQSRSLQDVMEKTLILGGALVVLLCAAAIIVMWMYEKRIKKKAQADALAASATQNARIPSRYVKLREEVLNKKPDTAEDLLFSAYLKEQRMAEAAEMAELDAAFDQLEAELEANTFFEAIEAEEPEADALPEAIGDAEPHTALVTIEEAAPAIVPETIEDVQTDFAAEAIEDVQAGFATEAIEDVHTGFAAEAGLESEKAVATETLEEESFIEEMVMPSIDIADEKESLAFDGTPVPEPDVTVTEEQGELFVTADSDLDILSETTDVTAILDSAYTAMSSADWERALVHFRKALTVTKDPYSIQRIKLELLNMHMRLDRKREASDLVFDILGAGYKLNNAETTTLFNVLQELEKGVK